MLTYSTYLGGSSGAEIGQSIVVDSSGNVYVTGSTSGLNFPTTSGAYSPTYHRGKDVFITKLNSTATVLTYSTYLGGGGDEEGLGIAVDSSGNAYVTGYTNPGPEFTDFPVTSGAYQTAAGHGIDVFVSKLNSTGSTLLYSTFLGGTAIDMGKAIAVDSSGQAFVTGAAYSTDYPVTSGSYRTTSGGNALTDVFVTKLNSTGTGLIYSTFMGGSSSDEGNAIAIDSTGQAFVAGDTNSTNYTTTSGAYKTSLTGGSGQDAFVFKLNAAGTSLLYSTYIGSASGTQAELANAVAVDSTGKIYVAGFTLSSNFATTTSGYDRTYGGGRDGFLFKLNPSVTGTGALQYSTFIGGSGYEETLGIAVDPTTAGIVYVTGMTGSTNFTTTTGAYQGTSGGAYDAYVTKFNTTLSSLSSKFVQVSLGLNVEINPYKSLLTDYSVVMPHFYIQLCSVALLTILGAALRWIVPVRYTSPEILSAPTFLLLAAPIRLLQKGIARFLSLN